MTEPFVPNLLMNMSSEHVNVPKSLSSMSSEHVNVVNALLNMSSDGVNVPMMWFQGGPRNTDRQC